MANNAKVTSAHDVQDDGESYDEVLNWLSAENEMRIKGVKYDLLFQNYRDTTCTWVYKYSEIFGKRKYER